MLTLSKLHIHQDVIYLLGKPEQFHQDLLINCNINTYTMAASMASGICSLKLQFAAITGSAIDVTDEM